MKQYRTSLRHRIRTSAKLTERYWSDPEYRLKCINADRARRGRPLLSSVDEIARNWPRKRLV